MLSYTRPEEGHEPHIPVIHYASDIDVSGNQVGVFGNEVCTENTPQGVGAKNHLLNL